MKLILIDSSHQLCYTGVLSGRRQALETLFCGMERIFRENNVANKYHYSKLSHKIRDRMRGQMIRALENSASVQFNVFAHRKPKDILRKEWFLYNLPARIAQRLEGWLVKTGGRADIIVDDDYNVLKGGHGTEQFARRLLHQISMRLSGKEATIRAGEALAITIRQPSGETLSISAIVADKNSPWVGLIDVYLGYYIEQPKPFATLRNAHFHEI